MKSLSTLTIAAALVVSSNIAIPQSAQALSFGDFDFNEGFGDSWGSRSGWDRGYGGYGPGYGYPPPRNSWGPSMGRGGPGFGSSGPRWGGSSWDDGPFSGSSGPRWDNGPRWGRTGPGFNMGDRDFPMFGNKKRSYPPRGYGYGPRPYGGPPPQGAPMPQGGPAPQGAPSAPPMAPPAQ